ncbi:hypothetical protein FLK61_24050 [Paenalkalicoccus suaedae]|uniref:Uncharacterized protein n=1 Tax=Paenalkalicoccus suaedae TaxID=2592382 RepID=A0A859F9M0_9BACI|nr:hypothetical protein [Paenalkalicoccus suaedae]QKS69863.1 hypothetical protein FLK61_24050 [Paenalkalicoccus suaedae]
MTNYRKRMFRGAKIEDCIEDFIQMEQSSRIDMHKGEEELALVSKGMNIAYRYIVNRMVRDFDYQRGELEMEKKLLDLEKLFRRLSESNLEQSKKDLLETVQETHFKEDILEEALDDLKNISPDNQRGMFEGMSVAYEQVANYISIVINSTDKISLKHLNQLILLIENNHSVKAELQEEDEDTVTYQNGFANGMKAGFNLAKMEMKQMINMEK